MIYSLMQRKGSYLAKPEWRFVPWQGRVKPYDETLIDKGFVAAGLLEIFDGCKHMSESDAEEARARALTWCTEKLQLLELELDSWYAQLAEEYGSPVYWFDKTPTGLEGGNPQSLDGYRTTSFPNLRLANAILICWALRVLISATVSTSKQMLLGMQTPHQEVASGGLTDATNDANLFSIEEAKLKECERADLCSNIFQATPFFLRPDFGANGVTRCLWPVGIAMEEMARQSNDKILWGSKIYAHIMMQKRLNWPVAMRKKYHQEEVIDR